MKKFFTTILAVIYLTTSIGATVNMHYCMGRLMGWDLSDKSESKCHMCGMEKSGSKGCCKDIQKIIEVNKDQKISEFAFQFQTLSNDLAFAYAEWPGIYYYSATRANPITLHPPPILSAVSIFVFYCNFRI